MLAAPVPEGSRLLRPPGFCGKCGGPKRARVLGFRYYLFSAVPVLRPFCPFLGVFRDFWPKVEELPNPTPKRAKTARFRFGVKKERRRLRNPPRFPVPLFPCRVEPSRPQGIKCNFCNRPTRARGNVRAALSGRCGKRLYLCTKYTPRPGPSVLLCCNNSNKTNKTNNVKLANKNYFLLHLLQILQNFFYLCANEFLQIWKPT